MRRNGTFKMFNPKICVRHVYEDIDGFQPAQDKFNFRVHVTVLKNCFLWEAITWGIQVVRYPNFFLGNGSR